MAGPNVCLCPGKGRLTAGENVSTTTITAATTFPCEQRDRVTVAPTASWSAAAHNAIGQPGLTAVTASPENQIVLDIGSRG